MKHLPPYVKMPPDSVREDCLSLVLWKAQKYDVPPAYVVAHIREIPAVKARREVMHTMLSWGMTRGQVAFAFGRDLRRVRASVLGEPDPRVIPPKMWHDYARFDLFGRPLPRDEREGAKKPTPGRRRGARWDARQPLLLEVG